jgi:hypothetical protein
VYEYEEDYEEDEDEDDDGQHKRMAQRMVINRGGATRMHNMA